MAYHDKSDATLAEAVTFGDTPYEQAQSEGTMVYLLLAEFTTQRSDIGRNCDWEMDSGALNASAHKPAGYSFY